MIGGVVDLAYDRVVRIDSIEVAGTVQGHRLARVGGYANSEFRSSGRNAVGGVTGGALPQTVVLGQGRVACIGVGKAGVDRDGSGDHLPQSAGGRARQPEGFHGVDGVGYHQRGVARKHRGRKTSGKGRCVGHIERAGYTRVACCSVAHDATGDAVERVLLALPAG